MGHDHSPERTETGSDQAQVERIKHDLGRKYTIPAWERWDKAQRESALRSAYLAPASAIRQHCRTLRIGLSDLSRILRDNKFRPREFLAVQEGHDHDTRHDHSDGEEVDGHAERLSHESQRVGAALGLRNALLEPATFPQEPERYQAVGGWRVDTLPILLPDGRGGHATLPVRDADGDQIAGRILSDASGRIVAIEHATLLTPGMRLSDDKSPIRFQVGDRTYGIRLDARAPRAFTDNGAEPNRRERDNGHVFRLSEVRPTLDREGRITFEKRLQEELKHRGYRSREALRDLLTSLLKRYSEEELGIVGEDERVGWKKIFGGGKIRSLAFITRLPTDFGQPTSMRDATEQARRVSSYRSGEPILPTGLRERSGSELDHETLSVRVPVHLSERLRDLPSIADRAFYREWLQRTPREQVERRLAFIVRYGREQAMVLLERSLRERSRANREDATRLAHLRDPGFERQALSYLLGRNDQAPPGLPDALFHGRTVAAQLSNGRLDDFLANREDDAYPARGSDLQRLSSEVADGIAAQSDLPHEHRLSLRNVLATQVFTVGSDIAGPHPNFAAEQRTEFPLPLPLGRHLNDNLSGKIESGVSYGPDGWTREIPITINYRVVDQRSADGRKHLLIEAGGGLSGPHAHGILQLGRLKAGFEAEGSWSWGGFVSEIDGFVQWYDALERSAARFERYQRDGGYHLLSAGLARILRSTIDPQQRLQRLHSFLNRRHSHPEAERLRSYLASQVSGYVGDAAATVAPEVFPGLFLRAMRNYQLALRETAVLNETRNAPWITGVKFGLLLANGTLIPLFGPLLRGGIRLEKSWHIAGIEDVDALEVATAAAHAPPVSRSSPSNREISQANKALHYTRLETAPPGSGTFSIRFPALQRHPLTDRSTVEVYAEPGIGFEYDAQKQRVLATGMTVVLERTIIAANGERIVRLELYREAPPVDEGSDHGHGGGAGHEHVHEQGELILRSFTYPLRDAKGRATGTFQRSTMVTSDIPRDAALQKASGPHLSVISRLEQQSVTGDPLVPLDRRRYGIFMAPNALTRPAIQFLDHTSGH